MAFEEKKLKNKIWQRFSFFASGDPDVASGDMDEDFVIDGDFELQDIRLHFSGVCSADIYFRATLSSIISADHDVQFLSYGLNNSIHYFWQPSIKMLFLSGDTIQLSCITDNIWGMTVSGWAVTGVN